MSECKCDNDPGKYYDYDEDGCCEKKPEDKNKYKIAFDGTCVNICSLGGYSNYQSTIKDNDLKNQDYETLCNPSINKIYFPDDIKKFLEILITAALNINMKNNLIEQLIPINLKSFYNSEIKRISDNSDLIEVSTTKLHLGNDEDNLECRPLYNFLAGLLNIFGAVIYNILYRIENIENNCKIFESLFELIFDYDCSMYAINKVSDCLKNFSNFNIPENDEFIKRRAITFEDADLSFFFNIYDNTIHDICNKINKKILNYTLYDSLYKFEENTKLKNFCLTIGTSNPPVDIDSSHEGSGFKIYNALDLLDIHKDLDLYLILLIFQIDMDKVKLYLKYINLDLYSDFNAEVTRITIPEVPPVLGGARKYYYSNKIKKYQEKIKKLKF